MSITEDMLYGDDGFTPLASKITLIAGALMRMWGDDNFTDLGIGSRVSVTPPPTPPVAPQPVGFEPWMGDLLYTLGRHSYLDRGFLLMLAGWLEVKKLESRVVNEPGMVSKSLRHGVWYGELN